MKLLLEPAPLSGVWQAIPSKSVLHRALICAAVVDGKTEILCSRSSDDIDATADCLRAMGAGVMRTESGFVVMPIGKIGKAALFCRESGSTLRFLLPLAAALGCEATFFADEGLQRRPIAPLKEALASHGVCLSEGFPLTVTGKLQPGRFELPGSVSSQFISGLLLALPLLEKESRIEVAGKLGSAPYTEITLQMLSRFGVRIERQSNAFSVRPSRFRSPGRVEIEGDWSNGAFALAAGLLGGSVTVTGLQKNSPQGDADCVKMFAAMGGRLAETDAGLVAERSGLHGILFDASQNPDLVPVVAALAAVADGTTVITGAGRLRYKESDRLETVSGLINALGGDCEVTSDGLVIRGKPVLQGGMVDACGDHRVAMCASVLAGRCVSPVLLTGAECISKSDPLFFEDFGKVGAKLCFLSETT